MLTIVINNKFGIKQKIICIITDTSKYQFPIHIDTYMYSY